MDPTTARILRRLDSAYAHLRDARAQLCEASNDCAEDGRFALESRLDKELPKLDRMSRDLESTIDALYESEEM